MEKLQLFTPNVFDERLRHNLAMIFCNLCEN